MLYNESTVWMLFMNKKESRDEHERKKKNRLARMRIQSEARILLHGLFTKGISPGLHLHPLKDVLPRFAGEATV